MSSAHYWLKIRAQGMRLADIERRRLLDAVRTSSATLHDLNVLLGSVRGTEFDTVVLALVRDHHGLDLGSFADAAGFWLSPTGKPGQEEAERLWEASYVSSGRSWIVQENAAASYLGSDRRAAVRWAMRVGGVASQRRAANAFAILDCALAIEPQSVDWLLFTDTAIAAWDQGSAESRDRLLFDIRQSLAAVKRRHGRELVQRLQRNQLVAPSEGVRRSLLAFALGRIDIAAQTLATTREAAGEADFRRLVGRLADSERIRVCVADESLEIEKIGFR